MTVYLSIVIPVFNERGTIVRLFNTLSQVATNAATKIVLVDDGSSDGSAEVLGEIQKESRGNVLVITHQRNRGKGAAIRSGLAVCDSEWVVIQDADLEYDPSDIPRLLQRAAQGDVDAVYGSRYMDAERNPSRYNLFAGGVTLLNLAVRLWYGVRLTDEATCYKLFRVSDLKRMELECTGFEFCPEVTAKACRMGLRIAEIPISYRPRSRREGKKIRLRDGWIALGTLWRWRKWNAKTCVPTSEPISILHQSPSHPALFPTKSGAKEMKLPMR